jgi:uncharacterized protein (DUF433 family)
MGAEKPISHIESTPGVLGGKPRIAGRRISVQHVVMLHDRAGWTADEIASEFDLDLADVYAALAYYFDNREEIDEQARADRDFIEKMKKECLSRLRPSG